MRQFPAFLNLRGAAVVIAGGGEAAARKARLLLAAGAEVRIYAPRIEPALKSEFAGAARLVEDAPAPADFAGAKLVIIAEENVGVAERLAREARRAGALVNVVDRPALCDFTFPSIIDRGEVVVAVGTDGSAPVLARRVRERIEALLPARLGAVAAFARRFRDRVATRLGPERRRAFWERVFDGPVAEKILAGDEAAAEAAFDAALDENAPRGVVHIVGAGPGDPELLTLRALRLISDADVILHDRLVSDAVLNLSRRDAERIYVGKAQAEHSTPQRDIEARMIALARAGKRVVRLKGGDPFIFGRGGEEMAALRAAGVDVFVTPGVTAALGCAAALGLPLTHRDVSQAVTLVTGHARDDGEPEIDWKAAAALKHTLVVYMGVGRANAIEQALIGAGRAPSTPVAVVENGTRPDQKTLTGTLEGLGALVAEGALTGPALLIIGEVAAFASADASAMPERIAA
jgi:uroporphyrin-III C-methyltransferase/precorrin-2 dehydrogenase/sirohydrochlorin ferrochelatase